MNSSEFRAEAERAWSELRLTALRELSFRAEAEQEFSPQLMAALATCGERSSLAAAQAATALEAGPGGAVWAPIAHAVAWRGFARAQARAIAERHAAALERWPQWRELLHEDGLSFSLPALVAERCLRSGDLSGARAALLGGLDDAPPELAPLVWLEALPALAGSAFARDDASSAIALIDRFATGFAQGERTPSWRLVAGYAALWSGDRARIQALAQRDNRTGTAPLAQALLQRLALADTTPRVYRAERLIRIEPATHVVGEGRAVLRRLLGDPAIDAQPTSLAGIRAALESRGLRTARVLLTEQLLPRLLDANAWVLLAEERSTGTGFSRVAAYERVSGLLSVERFDFPGAGLRSWADQVRRSQLHGCGALIVVEPSAAFAAEMPALHTARLEALDACEADLRGEQAGRGRQAHLSAAAIEACAEVPRAWQLRGEALLEQLRARELDGAAADNPFDHFYASARERFEHAEWAHQLYAYSLEHHRLPDEAAIAWADASVYDPFDHRNLLGASRGARWNGEHARAYALAERAFALAPELPEARQQLAAAALSAGQPERAAAAAELALARDACDQEALQILGRSRELEGELASAAELFERATAAGDSMAAPLQAGRCRLRLFEYRAAAEHAREAQRRDPQVDDVYKLGALAQRAMGEVEQALWEIDQGLSQLGPDRALLGLYANLALQLPAGDARSARLDRVRERWPEQTLALVRFADDLEDLGEREFGQRFAATLEPKAEDALTFGWWRARSQARARRWDDAASTLVTLLDGQRNAYFAVMLDCIRALRGDPPNDLLQSAEPHAAPALLWGLMCVRAEALGDQELALANERRCAGLPVHSMVEASHFLAGYGFAEAQALLDLLVRHPDASGSLLRRTQAELACVLKEPGGAARACEALSTDEHALVYNYHLDAALAERDAKSLRTLAERRHRSIVRAADLDWGDGMHERALIALADHWSGDPSALAALRVQFLRHPDVRLAEAKVES